MPPVEQVSKNPSHANSTPSKFETSDDSRTFGLSVEAARRAPDVSWSRRSEFHPRSQQRSPSASSRSDLTPSKHQDTLTSRQIIVDSFAPRITCYASTDADGLIRLKGFNSGLRELLCSFGERVEGNVTIRDSLGISREWHDFGIRFIDPSSLRSVRAVSGSNQERAISTSSNVPTSSTTIDPSASIDELLQHYLEPQVGCPNVDDSPVLDVWIGSRQSGIQQSGSNGNESLYMFYLRKVLSSTPVEPYETFSHPIACIIAVSSRNETPIDSLHQLYECSNHVRNDIPQWVNTDYLRYYVLIHDEENDDIVKSTALFDLMKRHFGLHCHLLRLRSSHCVRTDDDSIQVPPCEWLSADEELGRLRNSGMRLCRSIVFIPLTYQDHSDLDCEETYIHESDATAVKGFIREMVTQSLIPFMEGRINTWNDQVASRRRGISARFISLSKRITNFGTNKVTLAGPKEASGSPGNNFDSSRGFYSPETSEAILRQLGDYAFMLRDWKLANATYELVRTDFANDKAWKHHAAATEMCAISSLLVSWSTSARNKYETIDQMLDSASYSYLIRSSMPFGTMRCLSVAVELLKDRGDTGAVDGAKWGSKLLEMRLMNTIPQAFLSERIANCHRSRNGAGLLAIGSRQRHAALWDLLSSTTWMYQGTMSRAHDRLRLASIIYQDFNDSWSGMPFPSMQGLWGSLKHAVHSNTSFHPSMH